MSDNEEVEVEVEDINNEEDYSQGEPNVDNDDDDIIYDDDMDSDEEFQEENEREYKENENIELEDTDSYIIENDNDNDDNIRQFDTDLNYVEIYHPEDIHVSFEEMYKLSLITRNENGIIIDDNHKTFPILSKYEKTKILGLRVTQLNKGSEPYVDTRITLDASLIAEKELKEKKIPFIIKRPLPSGKYEFWNVKDLELI
jgi:DNA-directed RNA polymerase I, II, and III subunit RPABC2